MCYFHVKENIKKNRNLVSSDILEEIMDDITSIHMSINEKEYEINKLNFKTKYSKYTEIYSYIEKQWFNVTFKGDFTKWQIFRNPPGFANTNSNIESFNATIKRDFTGRKKLKINSALQKLDQIIHYYSNDSIIFMLQPIASKKMVQIANRLVKTCFQKIRGNRVAYTGKNNKFILNLENNSCYKSLSCSCQNFLKSAICIHVYAYSKFNDLKYYGQETCNEDQSKFVHKTKKGRPAHMKKALYKD